MADFVALAADTKRGIPSSPAASGRLALGEYQISSIYILV